jgi:hypothetical protein
MLRTGRIVRNGIAFDMLILVLRATALALDDLPTLWPTGRELNAFAACDTLSVPLYATFGDIDTARPSPTVVQIQVQAIYDNIIAGAIPRHQSLPSEPDLAPSGQSEPDPSAESEPELSPEREMLPPHSESTSDRPPSASDSSPESPLR